MKNYFKKHQEVFLVIGTIFFLAILAAFYFLVIKNLISDLNKAINQSQPEEEMLLKFNLEEAAKLPFRGQ